MKIKKLLGGIVLTGAMLVSSAVSKGTIFNKELSVSAAFTETSGKCGDNLTWNLSGDGTLTISGTGKMDTYHSVFYPQIFSERRDIRSVKINNGVTSISDSAFRDCTAITSISIPNSVTTIGYGAFYGCTSLTSVNLPTSANTIGDNLFSGCTSLKSINIPGNIPTVTWYMFENCTALRSVNIANGVKEIYLRAFEGCKRLESINIPESVTSINYAAFNDCTSLKSITINNQDCIIDDNASTIYYEATIYGHANSTAQDYAKKYNRKFKLIGSAPQNVNLNCDANGDGKLNVRDAAHIAKLLAQGKSNRLTAKADFNGDGKINVRDAASIAKYLANK